MKIYIVTSGSNDYESYQIERVFLDKNNAIKWLEMNKEMDEITIEEWESFDDIPFYPVAIIYCEIIRYKDGEKKEDISIEHKSNDVKEYEYRLYTTRLTPYTQRDILLGKDKLQIKKRLENNKLSDQELKEKYKNTCNELLTEIDNFKNYSEEMIFEWLSQKDLN